MQKGLVSLLTPMYNTEKYVHRLLDSICNQTYPNIELIVIDDGSTDNSQSIVVNYIKKFESRGYSLRYVYQENSGQSIAISNGLKLIHGEYLAWPDSDDYYATDDAIELMVNVLKTSGNEFQMVRSQEVLVEDGTFKPVGVKGEDANEEEPRSLFEDCLFAKNGFYYSPGAYMVRTDALYEMTGFNIYTEKGAGQNWQLMLPILYKYRCKTILKPLYHVVLRKESHSRGQFRGYDGCVKRFSAYLNTQIETLKRIDGLSAEKVEYYKEMLSVGYNKKLLWVAVHDNNRKAALQRFHSINKKPLSTRQEVLATLLHIKGGTYIINCYLKIRKGFMILTKQIARRIAPSKSKQPILVSVQKCDRVI